MMPCFFIAAPPHDTELNTQTSQQNCETTCVKLTIEFARHYTLQPEQRKGTESPLVAQIKHTVSHKKQTVHVHRLMPYRTSETVPEEEEPTTNSSPDEHQNTDNNPAEYSQSQPFFLSQSFSQSQSFSETQSPSQFTRFRREIRRPARYS